MGRAGDGDSYLDLLARARRLMPDVALRSTFIVGFPGETEAHFEHLLDFVREAEFDYAGGFIYSPEEGTPAARLRPRVPRRRRAGAAEPSRTRCWRRRRSARTRGMVGSAVEVMIDSVGRGRAGR